MFTTESEDYVNTWYNKLSEDLYNHTTQILYNFKVFVSCLTPKMPCKKGKEDIYSSFLIEEALGQLKLSVYKVLKEHEFKSAEKMMGVPTLFKRALHSSQMLNYLRAIYSNEHILENILNVLAIAPKERENYSKEYLDNIYMHSPHTIPSLIFYDTWPNDFKEMVKRIPLNNLNKQLAYIDYQSADEYKDALFKIIQGRVITNGELFYKYLRINSYCTNSSSTDYDKVKFIKEHEFLERLAKTLKNKSKEEYTEIMYMYVMRICIEHGYTNTDRLNYFKKFINLEGFKRFHTIMLLENQPMTFYLDLLSKKYAEKPIKCNTKVIKFML